jgi:hypothetical protein
VGHPPRILDRASQQVPPPALRLAFGMTILKINHS